MVLTNRKAEVFSGYLAGPYFLIFGQGTRLPLWVPLDWARQPVPLRNDARANGRPTIPHSSFTLHLPRTNHSQSRSTYTLVFRATLMELIHALTNTADILFRCKVEMTDKGNSQDIFPCTLPCLCSLCSLSCGRKALCLVGIWHWTSVDVAPRLDWYQINSIVQEAEQV